MGFKDSMKFSFYTLMEGLNQKKSVKFHNREGSLDKFGLFSHFFYFWNGILT